MDAGDRGAFGPQSAHRLDIFFAESSVELEVRSPNVFFGSHRLEGKCREGGPPAAFGRGVQKTRASVNLTGMGVVGRSRGFLNIPARMPRLSGHAARLLRGVRRILDVFPISLLGLLLVGSAAAALRFFAYGELDLVLLVVGYGAVGLSAIAVLSVTIAAFVIKRTGRVALVDRTLLLETHEPARTGFSVSSLRFFPLVQVRWTWDEVKRGASDAARESARGLAEVEQLPVAGRLEEMVRLRDRGELSHVRRRLVVEDAFGVARIGLRHDDPCEVTILPRIGALGRLPLLASLAGGDEQPHPMGLEDGDRTELRRYAPGDPARFIHWKVFGRTRRLMVRMPERALSRARRIVAYLVAGPDDDASAAVARVSIESGALGADWTFSADGAAGDASTRAAAIPLIPRSVFARDAGGAGLNSFLARAEKSGPASVVVFAPPRPGPWLPRVLEVARQRRGRIRVVVGIDAVETEARSLRWSRFFVRPRPRLGVPSGKLDEVLRALAGAGCEVIVLDRTTGKVLGERHRVVLRESAATSSSPAPTRRDAA